MDVCELSRLMPEAMALFENDAVGVAIVRDGVVERCNRKLERLHGCAPGALLGRRIALVRGLPAADAGAGSKGTVFEKNVARDDGGTLWLRATAHEARDEPGHRRTLWIVEDLTEREQAREAGRRARRRAADMALQLKRMAVQLHEDLSRWRGGPQRNLQYEDRLRRAIRRQAFELHYQPIVDLRSLAVCSVEALLRWRDEDGVWVPPSEFVPVAEACGLIQPIGEWSLREACRQAGIWRRAGARMPIAVNLSPCQLRQPDVVEVILDTLADAGIGPGQIELEITETSLMESIDETLPKLRRLAASGLNVAIDDFGTGYSSLSYLRRLPIHKLKIDKSFVRELQDDCTDFTIVSAVIGLAKSLGLTTVAEGVETQEQLHILRALGCDYIQGYHFCAPGPAATLVGMLGEGAK